LSDDGTTKKITGFLNINKPSGMTSHDVVSKVRWMTKKTSGTKKVGHAGTLDPLATGVLVLCLGNATRLSEYAMQSRKAYRARVYLGKTTDTYDAEGDVIDERNANHIQRDDVESVLPQFTGDIEQLPPMYSAVKKGGKKLYELAREGKEVEREARPVTIYEIHLVAWQPPELVLDVVCGSGTYIRSLAYDIGDALDVGAYLSGLARTRSGHFQIEDAVELQTLLDHEDWREFVVPPGDGLADWHALHLTPSQAEDISHGRFIEREGDLTDEYIMAYLPDGHLLAVLENRGSHWKPHKVFPPQSP
jgi:tRNA pseudouridine55 synthase